MLPFLTMYDPLGNLSGSIDPLGALQSYGELADLFLPRVTTITTRSRYLSMLCAALRNAENLQNFPPGTSGLAKRRKSVEPFERLWSVACVAAQEAGNPKAADGLRGITYAEKALRNFKDRQVPISPDFKLLKYQSRTGAVGTYWTTLIGGQLIHPDSGTLTTEGRDLAAQFADPPLTIKDREQLTDPQTAHRVSLGLREFETWAGECHLGAATAAERRHLYEALTADDGRECVAQALHSYEARYRLPVSWDVPALKKLKTILSASPRAAELGFPAILDAVMLVEQFHEAALAVFEYLLWWGTREAVATLNDLIYTEGFITATERSRVTAENLVNYSAHCEIGKFCDALNEFNSFARAISRCLSNS